MRLTRASSNGEGTWRVWSFLGCWSVLCYLIGWVIAGGASAANSPSVEAQIWVARVEDRVITPQEFQVYLEEQWRRNPRLQLTRSQNRDLLEKYVEKVLLVTEAEREGLNQDPEVIKDLEEAREQILVRHLLKRQSRKIVGEPTEIKDAEIQRYHADMGIEIRFQYLVAPNPEDARKILAKWSPQASPPGLVDTGKVKLATLDEAWKEQLRVLPVNTPKVVNIGSDSVLVQVLSGEDASTPPLDQVKNDIIKELSDRKNREKLDKWVNGLKAMTCPQ